MRRATLLSAALLAGLIAAPIVAVGSPASAQTRVVPKRRTNVPVAAPRPAPPVAPASSVAGAPARLSLSGLRSPGDGGATCRNACARTRYACEVQEDSCAPDWTSCLKTCSEAAAVPQGALLPRR